MKKWFSALRSCLGWMIALFILFVCLGMRACGEAMRPRPSYSFGYVDSQPGKGTYLSTEQTHPESSKKISGRVGKA